MLKTIANTGLSGADIGAIALTLLFIGALALVLREVLTNHGHR